jgi:nondiscriminating glutamyl-tRNA synthetase
MVKVRFAPSPTGHLHLGNAKVALLNYLFTRNQGGEYILRIEDTDLERSDASFETSILDDLTWLGIAWDEGPLRQTERFDIYRSYANILLDKGAAYKCFCSQETLEKMREASLKKGEPPRYDGTCRKLSDQEVLSLEKIGTPYVVRFKSLNKPITFIDSVHGEIQFPRDHVDDFILMKQKSTPSYNFAVTIDDMAMEITHVIRGADHISNTPKQIMLFEALGKEAPQYGHHSLLVGEDKKPLSKRHGVTRVKDFREMGILPSALLNYLGTIGRNVKKEIMNMDELSGTFSLTSLSRADSVFDMEKLYWFNKEYMKHIPLDILLTYLDLPSQYSSRISVLRENAATLNEMKEYLDIFDKADMSEEGRLYLSQLALQDNFVTKIAGFFTEHNIPLVENIINALMEEGPGLKKKDLYMILRIFLTGRKSGPPLKEILQMIPNDIIIKRIDRYLDATHRL